MVDFCLSELSEPGSQHNELGAGGMEGRPAFTGAAESAGAGGATGQAEEGQTTEAVPAGQPGGCPTETEAEGEPPQDSHSVSPSSTQALLSLKLVQAFLGPLRAGDKPSASQISVPGSPEERQFYHAGSVAVGDFSCFLQLLGFMQIRKFLGHMNF